MKQTNLKPLIFILLFLSSCKTVSPLSTQNIPTYTQSPTSTNIPLPTQSPNPPLVLAPFEAYLFGAEDHGNITCVDYSGDSSNIEHIQLSADFLQEGVLIESNKQAIIRNERICFENIDSLYQVGKNVQLALNISSTENIILINDVQIIDLGIYSAVPFIQPMFRYLDLNGNPYSADPLHDNFGIWFATDFCLVPKCRGYSGAPGEGVPVYLPGNVEVIVALIQDDNDPMDGKEFTNYMVNVYLPDTGYILSLAHVQPGPLLEELMAGRDKIEIGFPTNGLGVITYTDNIPFVYIGPKDDHSGLPHLHIEGQMPNAATDSYYGISDSNRYFYCPDGIGPCLPHGANFNLEKYLISSWVK